MAGKHGTVRRAASRATALLLACGLVALPSTSAVAAVPVTPNGAMEITSPAPGQVRVTGKVVDPDHAGPVKLHIWVMDRSGGLPVERLTDAGGDIDVTLPTDKTTGVVVDVYAFDRDSAGNQVVDSSNRAVSVQLVVKRSVTMARDTRPPVTTLTSYPPTQLEVEPGGTRSVPFTFVSDEPGSSFSCSIDPAGAATRAWSDCASPTSAQVGVGDHEFHVRAKDPAGVQGEPASYRFSVVPAAAAPPPAVDPGTSEAAALAVEVKAVKRRSRLRVRVSPASAEVDYRFVVQRKAGKKWRKVKRSVTRRAKDQKVLDLRRGRYRVLVPAQHGMTGARSKAVRLRR